VYRVSGTFISLVQLIVLRAYRGAEMLLAKCAASPTEPIEQISDRMLHRVRKIALKPVLQAMRDQTVYVGQLISSTTH